MTTSFSRLHDVEARISTGALRRNLQSLKTLLPDAASFAALVKSDGYGHGAETVARAALDEGAAFLAVAAMEEARGLRRAGFGCPLLVLGPIFEHQAAEAVALDLTVCVGNMPTARALAAVAAARNTVAAVHLKIDTGMGRFGFRDDPATLGPLVESIVALDGLRIEGVLTHYSEADDPGSDYTAEQTRRFRAVLDALAGRGVRPRWVHAANSGALVHFRETVFSLVRIGIALYGAYPEIAPTGAPAGGVQLEPVMSLVTRVADLRDVPAGTAVSYGRRFVTRRPSRLALLPLGYGNGYPRAATGKACAMIRGRGVPLVGTITMNLIVADVTDLPDVAVGDPVLMFGRLGSDELRVERVAEAAGAISYEILCNVGRCAPRVVVN